MKVWDLEAIKIEALVLARELMGTCPKYCDHHQASVWMNAGLIIAQSILTHLDKTKMGDEVYALKLFEREIDNMESYDSFE